MKRIAPAFALLCALVLQAQQIKSTSLTPLPEAVHPIGEFQRYRIHYGFINAGFAELSLEASEIDGKPYFHAKGCGYSTGLVRLFFKVRDRYETYIDPHSRWPRRFIRDIQEGGYAKHTMIDFDQGAQTAVVQDLKKKRSDTFSLPTKVQDLLSVFYFLRNMPPNRLLPGIQLDVNLFFDNQSFTFRLKILEVDELKTKFGRIPCLKVQPLVQDGRVFKNQEGVSIWVTQDPEHIPLRIEAQLAVGALRADLIHFENLKSPLKSSD